jgi:hypothetical protein
MFDQLAKTNDASALDVGVLSSIIEELNNSSLLKEILPLMQP